MHSSAETSVGWPFRRIAYQRRVPLGAVVVVCILFAAFTAYNMLIGFPPALRLARETDGLIQSGLIHTAILQLLLVAGFLIGFCRLTPSEVGLDVSKLPLALVVTAALWVASQGVQCVLLWLLGQKITLNAIWAGPQWHRGLGEWLYQLLGNAPCEEVIFRGFLLPQLVAQWMAHRPKMPSRRRIVVALVVSQAIFALVHVPVDWIYGKMWVLPIQFVFGLVFAGIYLWTGNLFLVMGVHTLSNNPAPLVATFFDGDHFIGLAIVLGIVLSINSSIHDQQQYSEDKPPAGKRSC